MKKSNCQNTTGEVLYKCGVRHERGFEKASRFPLATHLLPHPVVFWKVKYILLSACFQTTLYLVSRCRGFFIADVERAKRESNLSRFRAEESEKRFKTPWLATAMDERSEFIAGPGLALGFNTFYYSLLHLTLR